MQLRQAAGSLKGTSEGCLIAPPGISPCCRDGFAAGFLPERSLPSEGREPVWCSLPFLSPSPFLRKLKQDCAQTTLQHLGMMPWQD